MSTTQFSIRMLPIGHEVQSSDDNVDVAIDLADGRSFAATFFTVENLRTLMKHYADTGECAGGTYVWAADMIVVEHITREVIERVVSDLVASGEFEACCTRIR